MVLNKNPGVPKEIRVKTEDAEAKAGEDFKAVDTILKFAPGDKSQYFEVVIFDDDNWEPDEDFYCVLYEVGKDCIRLGGQDTKTRITIIDDDKPGQIVFKETKAVQALASNEFAEIVIDRKNGSDGIVKVDFATHMLDDTPHTATEGRDYEPVKGTL